MQYEKLFHQFIDFLKTVQEDYLTAEDFKLTNIIIKNFNEVAACGTAAGKRGKLINQLLQTQNDVISQDCIDFPIESKSLSTPRLSRLKSLEAERFRGFTEYCIFHFDKQFVLIFGPNGSGKSSLCEALEYTLLGYINEAIQKRILINDYIKNAYFTSAGLPVLKGVDENGELINVVNDPLKYHFCFIEKCRIDAFARLSGHTSSNQKELLSALFGLEQFNEFVTEFTDNIEKNIPIEQIKEREFEIKQKALEGHRQVKIDAESKQSTIDEKKKIILSDSKMGLEFEDLGFFIHGNAPETGRLYDLKQQITGTSKVITDIKSITELFNEIEICKQHAEEFRKIQEQFERSAKDIDFAKLYAAVLQVEAEVSNKCPVCETSLANVDKQPYDFARERLKDLKDTASIDKIRKDAWTVLYEEAENIVVGIKSIQLVFQAKQIMVSLSIPEQLVKNNSFDIKRQQLLIEEILFLIKEMDGNKMDFLNAENIILLQNQEIQRANNSKPRLVLEFEELSRLSDRIREVITEEKTLREMTTSAEFVINEFNNTTEHLQQEILLEKIAINKNKAYVNAYKGLKQKMVSYKDQLPLLLVEHLNELVMEFYNLINMDDEHHELIASISLPTVADKFIRISFRDQPQKYFNALQVLSEGHIKCLGLSILLAKSIHSGANFIIFNDIVNAIDDDHRGNIRDLFLTNDHFKNRQLIITSHSEEFIKDFENRVSKKDYADKVQKISFLKRSGKKIQKMDTTFNYLQNAEVGLVTNNKRELLTNCRKALENISDTLWKKLIKLESGKYNINISVQLRGPSQKPELLSLLAALRKAIKPLPYAVGADIGAIIDWFSGLNSIQPNVWQYLNKGTHEESERDDFDLGIVTEIFEQTKLLDYKIKEKWIENTL